MAALDPSAVAREVLDAYWHKRSIAAPSGREGGLDLAAAYAVESEIVQLRRAEGRATAGLKVGFANKAIWRALKLETLVWAHMYDDTVHHSDGGSARLAIGHMFAPKVEPEIVFKLKRPLGTPEVADAAATLEAVEWIALGFEIIDCVFPDWKFGPTDFVASKGLHAGLIVGQPLMVTPGAIPSLVEQLSSFTVALMHGDRVVAEGAGKNSLRSPALCLSELASAIARRPGAEPLAAGALISSGTLTDAQPILPGQTWTARVQGLDVAPVTLHTDAA